MSGEYDTLVGRRQARIVALLERNQSVRAFIQELVAKLSAHAASDGGSFEQVLLDQPYITNFTGDEYIRARILRGPS